MTGKVNPCSEMDEWQFLAEAVDVRIVLFIHFYRIKIWR